MMSIPLNAVPNQALTTNLANQSCQIELYQLDAGLFCNLYINNAPIVVGVICQNLNRLVRSLYLGFAGDLVFYDTEGANDPYYSGLGARYQLIYIEASELPAGVG